MPDSKHLHIDPETPDPDAIRRAVAVIRAGGVVIYPTSLLYGLGADATDRKAVQRVFSIKRRAATKPVSILIHQKSILPDLVREIPDAAREIMDRLWPGKVTLVFYASAAIPEILTAGTGKIGIRLPLHPVAKMFMKAAGVPVTATSANLSGDAGGGGIAEIAESVCRQADLILDAGPLPGGVGSTVVDVTVSPPTILREGAVSAAHVLSGRSAPS